MAQKTRPNVCYITSWDAGLGFMRRADMRNPVKVLKVLDEAGKFSIFEATANQIIAKTMTYLVDQKLIAVDNSPGYPWSNVKLTAKGREYLRGAP